MNQDTYEWIDQQTVEAKPAILMIHEPGDEDGHAYLCNAPAFGMPVVVALDVPHEFLRDIGGHLDFLWEEHQRGHLVLANQTTSHERPGGHWIFKLLQPDPDTRDGLLRHELCQTYYRWPDADVLLLEILLPDEVAKLKKPKKPTWRSKKASRRKLN